MTPIGRYGSGGFRAASHGKLGQCVADAAEKQLSYPGLACRFAGMLLNALSEKLCMISQQMAEQVHQMFPLMNA